MITENNSSIIDEWYKHAYDINMQLSSWTFTTKEDIDEVLRLTGLKPPCKVLDIACGYGRHAIELAKRGYNVTGIDISPSLIAHAKEYAVKENADIEFLCADIRSFKADTKFDLCLNLYDGAIGYLENDEENHKIFNVISQSLQAGGLSVIHLHTQEYADEYFPQYLVRKSGSLVENISFTWDKATKYMFEITRTEGVPGEVIERKRLYAPAEIAAVMKGLGMELLNTWPDPKTKGPDETVSRYAYYVSKKTRM